MLGHIAILGISFIFSLISILCVLVVSRRFGLYDRIDERKVHTGNIPRLGGIGIFAGFVLGLVLFSIFSDYQAFSGQKIWYLIVGCAMIFVMGVWDDMKPWKARIKLLVQCVAAILVLVGGFAFNPITFGPLGLTLDFGIFRYLITFCWIIGVTNSINLIDGIDGLAGSVSTMVALTYALFFHQYGNDAAALVCLLLAVSIGGFLAFNLPFPKAKIFMGDGGSQFLGFILAVLPFINNSVGVATIALPYAAAVLIIPIFDTIAAIWRRLREGRRIDSPDRLHLHHKLMMMGFSKRQTLVVIMVFQLVISIFVACSVWIRGVFALVLLFTVYLMGILFFAVVHIRKKEILEDETEEQK